MNAESFGASDRDRGRGIEPPAKQHYSWSRQVTRLARTRAEKMKLLTRLRRNRLDAKGEAPDSIDFFSREYHLPSSQTVALGNFFVLSPAPKRHTRNTEEG